MSEIKDQTSRLHENWDGLKSGVRYVAEINRERILRLKEKLTGKLETSAINFLERLNRTLEQVRNGHDFLLQHREDIINVIQKARTYAGKESLNPTVKKIIELAGYLEEYLQRHDARNTIHQVIS